MENNDKKIDKEFLKNSTCLYPTDTTFGIGCDATNVEAIRRIFEIKNRPDSKSLIILVDSPARLQNIVDVPELAWDIMDLSEKPVYIKRRVSSTRSTSIGSSWMKLTASRQEAQ